MRKSEEILKLVKQFNYKKHSGFKIRRYYKINNNDIVLFFMGFLYDFAGLKELALELGKNKARYPNFNAFGSSNNIELITLVNGYPKKIPFRKPVNSHRKAKIYHNA